ncbi:FhaA domain-containing protein [Citricoccus sp. GCM10030269]|uniref:FhaA domain-containing protein n=1 Tax=Citricoccus sp. GCM10030269 TaxID=3273388 RepID=UPI00360F9CD2
MGLLDNLERGLEKAVQSAFTAGGSRAVKPVEIANALKLTMDDEAMALSEGRTFVPNVFTIKFSSPDFELARKWGSALAEELCDEAIRHARDQSYTLHGPVRVTFIEDEALKAGKLEIESLSDRSGGADQAHDAGSSPSGTGSAAVVNQAPVDRQAPVETRAPVSPAAPGGRTADAGRTPPAKPSTQSQAPLQPVLEIDGRKYGINADSIVLGRSADADIHVEDTGVSRRHLEIITRGRTVTAVDLGSTNGFYVNDRKVDGSTVLRDGDRVTMGRVRMVFRMLPARDVGGPGQDQRDQRNGGAR